MPYMEIILYFKNALIVIIILFLLLILFFMFISRKSEIKNLNDRLIGITIKTPYEMKKGKILSLKILAHGIMSSIP